MSFSSSKIWRLSALSVASICVSEPSCFATSMNDENINTLGDFKRFFYKNCWGAWASQKANNTFDKSGWYRSALLSTSIYDQIQTAIADCMTVNNEFNLAVQKRKQNPSTTTIVEFSTNPNGYNQNNWNAVVLYNYLAESIWGFLAGWKYGHQDQCIEFVGDLIANHYNKIPNINSYIDTAVQVIKMYAKDLDLYKYARILRIFRENPYQSYADINYGGYLNTSAHFDELFKSAIFCLPRVLTIKDHKAQWTSVNIEIKNGKVVEYQTPNGVYTSMTKSMQLSGQKSATLPKYKYQDLTQNKQPDQIHNLHNKWTCHVNSLITALSMSDLFRKAIAQVATMRQKTIKLGTTDIPLNLCKKINEIITEGIDNGKMANNNQNGCNYYQQLYNALKQALNYTKTASSIKRVMNTALEDGNWAEELNRHSNGQGMDAYVQKELQEGYDSTNIKEGCKDHQLVISELLNAISYELNAYGVENILSHTLIDINKQIPKTQQTNYKSSYSVNFMGEVQNGMISDTYFDGALLNELKKNPDLGQAIQQVMTNHSKAKVETFVSLSDGKNNVPATELIDSQIKKLPDVFAVIIKQKSNDIVANPNQPINTNQSIVDVKRTKEIQLTDCEGTKRYRLVSEMLHLPGHFVANVRLKDKFYTVDDTREDGDTAKEEQTFLRDYKNMSARHGTNLPANFKPITVAVVYERCG